MIARLYAMYQRSRKVLVLVVVVFIAINVTNTVILAINMKYISAGELLLRMKYFGSLTNTRTNHSFWHLSMRR
jgi:predicted metal-binding membrane protein